MFHHIYAQMSLFLYELPTIFYRLNDKFLPFRVTNQHGGATGAHRLRETL